MSGTHTCLSPREQKFLAKWERQRTAGRFNFFLRCMLKGAIGGLVLALVFILARFNAPESFTEAQKAQVHAEALEGIPQILLICIASLVWLLAYF